MPAKKTIVTLPSGSALELPYWIGAIMGKPGAGKTHFAASCPGPKLVLATDPITKMQPYFDQGVGNMSDFTIGTFGQKIWVIKDAAGNLLTQIEGFYDTDPTMVKSAMTAFTNRVHQLPIEVENGTWRTVVVDSWSTLEDCASDRRLTGPLAVKAGGAFAAHRGAAKEDLRQLLRIQLIHLPCNVVMIFHVTKFAKEDGGEVTYTIRAIGDFAQTLGMNLSERYLAEALPDGTRRQFKTKPDGRYDLTTLIDAPSPCENNYQALWGSYIAKRSQPAADTSSVATTGASSAATTE